MTDQADRTITVVARIDAYGGAELTTDGSPSRARLGGIEDARSFVGQHALDLAARLGRDVVLDTSDPDGSWVFVVRPDGSMVETSAAPTPQRAAPAAGPALAPGADQGTSASEGSSTQGDDVGTEEDGDGTAVVEPEATGGPQRPTPPATPPAPTPAAEPVPRRSWSEPQPWSPPAAPAASPPAPPAGGWPSPAAPTPAAGWGPAPVPLPHQAPPAPPVPPQPHPQAQPLAPQPASGAPEARRGLPTLDDLLGGRPAPTPGPAQSGWQSFLRKATFGLVKPGPGPKELQHREAVATIQRSLPGPRTVVVVNPKGGASKTTATMMLAATFATLRGGYTLAWDNNETRGTLGWRAVPARHTNTAVDLLADLERFQQVRGARVGDLDNYVRTQGAAQFDVLASDEDPAASASIDADAFSRLHATLSRFYRILVIDTGNNMRASNWEAAVAAADQLVIVSTIREDTAASAAWLVDGLRAKGHGDKVEHAVTVLSAPASSNDPALSRRLHDHFAQLTRAVVDVPHEPSLVAGGPIDFTALSRASRDAWVLATAKVAEGL